MPSRFAFGVVRSSEARQLGGEETLRYYSQIRKSVGKLDNRILLLCYNIQFLNYGQMLTITLETSLIAVD